MVTIGAALVWLGFGVVADGWATLRGCTWEGGIKALLVPGEFAGATCTSGTAPATTTTSSGAVVNGKCPAGFLPDGQGNCVPVRSGTK